MTGFGKPLNNMSLKYKLILYSYMFIVPVIIILSIFFFKRNYAVSIKEERDECMRSTNMLLTGVDSQLAFIADIGTYICINNEVLSILKSDDVAELNKDAQLWLHMAPMQMIQDIVALGGSVKTIAIYPENSVIPYLRCMDYSAYIASIEDIRDSEIYKQSCDLTGRYVFRRVEKDNSDTYLYNRNPKITAHREIYDLSRKHRLGYMVIGASADIFDKLCEETLRAPEEAVCVYNEQGELLAYAGGVDIDVMKSVVDSVRGQLEADGSVSCEGYEIYGASYGDRGLSAYRFVPDVKNRQILWQILSFDLILILGILIAFLPFLIIISSVITRPLNKLREAMNGFKEGDFTRRVEVTSMDEVGEVSTVFNDMVRDMKELIDTNYVIALKEKQSELDALQAQINPHFLYNALDTLYWKCIDADNEETGEDILALSQLFRLVLSRGNSIIPVSDEVKLLESYLHIQQIRFENRLSYKIDVDDGIMNERIPKLILQPFVENSVIHGFEKSNESFMLNVRGYADGKNMVFIIRDNGIGMTEKQISGLFSTGDKDGRERGHIGGYAVHNTYERLELTYHDDFRLDITSKPGQCTTVQLTLIRGYL